MTVNLLPRPAHLAAQLLRNRAYHAALLLTTAQGPWPPSPDDLAAEIARVAEVIRLIEADLGRLAGAAGDSEGGR